MIQLKNQIVFLVMLGLLLSCATSTKITAFWHDKNYAKGKIEKILILGISKRPAIRSSYEEDMQKKLDYYGVEGVPSYEIFPGDEKLDTNTFRLHFKNEGFDAVITAQLVSADKETRYEPGYGYAGYNGFYGYYGSAYNYMYSPGYSYTTTTLKIETNMYDAKTEKLIWSGISETFAPSDEMDAIRSLNQRITLELNKQGYFKPSK